VLGSDGLATLVESISREQAQQMVAMYTVDMMVICVLINIVTELLAGRFGMFINDKFFEKGAKESRLG
ncbi:MAG: MptD family putative ECF transporter S component, partial [Eggerthella sp.]|nr:MptD family putative ECF transporter S component [Eggerthella sp.]